MNAILLKFLERQADKLLAQIGKTSNRNSSIYQKYVDIWQDFFTAVGGSGLNIRVYQ